MTTMQSKTTVREGLDFVAQDLVECLMDLPRSDRAPHASVSGFAYDMRILVDGADRFSYYGAFAADEAKIEAFRMIPQYAKSFVECEAFRLAVEK